MILRSDIVALAERLVLHTQRHLSSLSSGSLKSRSRGAGMEFKEFRDYVIGDDVRHLSWAVTARTNRATIKVFEEERSRDVLMAVDLSGSSLAPEPNFSRKVAAAQTTALLGLSALKTGDNFGLFLFDQEPIFFKKPSRSIQPMLDGCNRMLARDPLTKQTSFRCLYSTLERLRKNSLIILWSDFLVPSFEDFIRSATLRHEIFLIHVSSALERGEAKHVYDCMDPETGQYFLLDGGSSKTRETLMKSHQERQDRLRHMTQRMHSQYVALQLEENYLEALVHRLGKRSLRAA